MSNNSYIIPTIKPINITNYEFRQSKLEHVPKLPFRSIIVASSTGGKTVLIQNSILNVIEGHLPVSPFFVQVFIQTLHSMK